jgi:hypothetical protein
LAWFVSECAEGHPYGAAKVFSGGLSIANHLNSDSSLTLPLILRGRHKKPGAKAGQDALFDDT